MVGSVAVILNSLPTAAIFHRHNPNLTARYFPSSSLEDSLEQIPSGGVSSAVEEIIASLNRMKIIKGKNITELIASGREKLASVPSGGGVAVAAAPTSGGAARDLNDMGFSLFE
ncbi:hypothetical protein ZOSMA_252G00100 [Zostera marina]|uniref:Uncharacterized protein n=1 Tax=Zostera marina TaxID=29655 RepID=A0A0K9PG03_ZOSMR|nr:hypothetical protein ZOSMA_252G00100 [Zostera marina]